MVDAAHPDLPDALVDAVTTCMAFEEGGDLATLNYVDTAMMTAETRRLLAAALAWRDEHGEPWVILRSDLTDYGKWSHNRFTDELERDEERGEHLYRLGGTEQ